MDNDGRWVATLAEGSVAGARLGLLGGVVAALVDWLDGVVSGFRGQVGFLLWVEVAAFVPLAAALGALLGAWFMVAQRLASRFPSKLWEAFCLGVPASAFVAWVPSSWIAEHFQKLSQAMRVVAVAWFPLAVLGTTVVTAALLLSWRRFAVTAPRRRLVATFLALLAAAAYLADRNVLVDLYRDFHVGLCGVFLAATFGACWVLRGSVRAGARFLPVSGRRLGLVLASSVASLVVLEWVEPDVFGPSRAPLFAKYVAVARALSDVDGDGYSNLFGGSDCAPFDADIGPASLDVFENDVDEDCSGTPANWPKPEPRPSYPVLERERHDLLLITVDALRADHLGAWGYRRHPTSPNIDRLAQRSVRFARASSPSPKTYESMPSLLSGLHPSNLARDYQKFQRQKAGKPKNGKRRRKRSGNLYSVGQGVALLPELLSERGYATGASHGIGVLADLGLDRGFDEIERSRDQLAFVERFIEGRLSGADRPPFFLWLHFYGPHAPYERHPEFPFGSRDIDRYDAEIARDDQTLGRVLERLESAGLMERTIVVLTADHGEEFRDHGGTFHGFRLYRELLHVPLLLSVPGLEPQVVDTPVELVDVAPTLCELLVLGDACGEHDGLSLLSAIAGTRPAGHGAYSEMYTKQGGLVMASLFTGKWKFIHDLRKDRPELYDVERDPAEQVNVARYYPEVVSELRERLVVRPLRRQGAAYWEYVETGDSLVLAQKLELFRQRDQLRLVLRHIGADLRKEHRPHLKALRARPNLHRGSKKQVDALLKRLGRR